MSITDELRKWGYGFCGDTHDVVTAIADRIDAEHEKAMIRAGQLLDDAEKERDYNYANWQECKQKVLQGNITFDELEHENESLKAKLDRERGEWDFWESTHVELPKDADGECIHIGDVMVYAYADNAKPMEVMALVPPAVFITEEGQLYADMCRHYHAPTVEDVLREFANEVYADADNEIRDRDFLCAKYAKRLSLAGDAE